ncbi:MAG: HNH endonuclease signature motif containing protein, partial [Motilibacteraceae bacterium]
LLACEAGIIPVVLNGEGRPIDVGRTRRLATPDQRRLLALRDKGCVGPGCDRPPDWSQAHHLTRWTLGGETNLDEMRLLCLWHHHLVHDQHWDIRATADGGTEWRAPAWVDPTCTWVRTR